MAPQAVVYRRGQPLGASAGHAACLVWGWLARWHAATPDTICMRCMSCSGSRSGSIAPVGQWGVCQGEGMVKCDLPWLVLPDRAHALFGTGCVVFDQSRLVWL